MPGSELHRKLRRYRAAVLESRETGVPVEEVFGPGEQQRTRAIAESLERSHELASDRVRAEEAAGRGGLTRRELLGRAAIVGAAFAGCVTLQAWPFARRVGAAAPRIVVVGAGFAGLSAAYRIHASRPAWSLGLYEAQSRVGGRARTIRTLAGGQYTEAGPSGISSNENVLKNLSRELGLWPLVDTWLDYPNGGALYYFLGGFHSWNDLRGGANDVFDACWRAWVDLGKRIPSYRNANGVRRRFDEMSVADFIDESTRSKRVRAYMKQHFGVEYGGRARESSAIHQILEEAPIWGGGGYDERYAVPGGNDALATALAGQLPGGALRLGHELTAIRRKPDGSYVLTFDNGSLVDVVADQVVLAIPPTTLRRVDLDRAGFGDVKLKSIRRTRMGTNSKLNFQFSGQPWKAAGRSGDANTELVTGTTWQTSYQGTTRTTLVMMNNHDYGGAAAHGTASGSALAEALAAIDTLFPGASANLVPGQTYLDNWPEDPWVRGSYVCEPPGGFTTYGGVEAAREGGVHFAGEHTATYIHGGTMNGAVESGERAAREITR